MSVPLCLRPYVVDRVRESNVPLPCKKFDQTNVSYNKINRKKNIIMQSIIRLGKENFTQVFFKDLCYGTLLDAQNVVRAHQSSVLT